MAGSTGFIEFEIIGDSRTVDNALRGMNEAFQNENISNDFLDDYVHPILQDRAEDRFASEGDDVTGPWADLQAGTVAIRQAQNFPGEHPINERTGAMKRFVTDSRPDSVPHSLGATMWFPGRGQPAAIQRKIRTAQGGGTTPQGRSVVPRPVLGVNELDLESILVALGKYVGKYQDGGERMVEFS